MLLMGHNNGETKIHPVLWIISELTLERRFVNDGTLNVVPNNL